MQTLCSPQYFLAYDIELGKLLHKFRLWTLVCEKNFNDYEEYPKQVVENFRC